MSVRACGSQRLATASLFYHSPLHYLRKDLNEPEVRKSAGLGGQQSGGLPSCASPTPQLQANAVTPDLLHVSSGDVNLGPCTCAASTVPTESSSYTPYTDLKPFTKII